MIKSISVYLGSAPGCDQKYKDLAYETGRRIAAGGYELVYGGADVGTMKSLADGAAGANGKVVGIFPRGFKGTSEVRAKISDIERHDLSEFILVKDFAERKEMMARRGDCCIVLPGSFGTLDELFTYATDKAIGVSDKPIFVLDHEGYYAPLRDLVANMEKAGFLKPSMRDALLFFDTLDELFEFVSTF